MSSAGPPSVTLSPGCPFNNITGGRVLWRGMRKGNNRAGQIFRLAAQSLHRSPTPLGEYLRRLQAKLGPAGAITATARKIATVFYTLVTRQVEFDHTLWHAIDAQCQRRIEARLTRQARRLGYQIVPLEVSPPCNLTSSAHTKEVVPPKCFKSHEWLHSVSILPR